MLLLANDFRQAAATISKKIKKAKEQKVVDGAGALYELAEEVIASSQPLVPVDIGTLKNSKFVKKPVVKGENASVTFGYGGQAEDYAIVQHEDLSLNHPNGGQAKYLEEPFLEMKARFPAALAAKIKARSKSK